MKRILTIQDISCVGKCSLTVALPVISAFGVEAAVLPTAVLSNHTAFTSWTFRDLTDDMVDIANKWKELDVSFDAVYTGYLGSKKQIDIVKDIIKDFKTETSFSLIDPVMADHGKLYTGFDLDFVKEMAKLCSVADIIVPNMTEACFMLGIPYTEEYDEAYIKDMLKKLTALGAKTAILTGITFDKKNLGAYGYNSETDEYFYYSREYLPVSFHGTGDIFASALLGALSIGKNQKEALSIAVDYTVECIIKTMQNEKHNWYGVDFESAIPYLTERIK